MQKLTHPFAILTVLIVNFAVFMKKALRILALYDELNSSNGVNLDNFIETNGISLSSFRRYINDINCYLAESYTGDEVEYDDQNKCYKITKRYEDY